MLTLIATPIGNLEDISQRARSALCCCDLVLCEDTRHTGNLFKILGLTPPRLLSLHRFNETAREKEVLRLLREGKHVGLVSDAGTPGISDPGADLIERCHHENLPVTIIPGPCAFVAAYALCGATAERVQFVGFLPKKKEQRKALLQEVFLYPGATVAYESPHRLKETIEIAGSIDPSWEIGLVRELTKMYEETLRMKAQDISSALSSRSVKGECTLIFFPVPAIPRPSDKDLIAQVRSVRASFSCSLKEAVEFVSKHTRVSQRELYQMCVKQSP